MRTNSGWQANASAIPKTMHSIHAGKNAPSISKIGSQAVTRGSRQPIDASAALRTGLAWRLGFTRGFRSPAVFSGGRLAETIDNTAARQKSARHGVRSVCALTVLAMACACASFVEHPAWNPGASAPPSPAATWQPAADDTGPQSLEEILALTPDGVRAAADVDRPAATTSADLLEDLELQLPPSSEAQPLELAELIGIALSKNPRTRQAWRRAQAAAAQLGESMSDYYPRLNLEARGGAEKFGFEFADSAVIVRQAQVEPELQLTYVLLDFGRRTAKAEAARAKAAAAAAK